MKRLLLLLALPLGADISQDGYREDLLLLYYGNDNVLRLERVVPESGRILWHFETGGTAWKYWLDSVVHVDRARGRVFVSSTSKNKVHALNWTNGAQVWESDFAQGSNHVFLRATDKRVFVSLYRSAHSRCFDAATGAVCWDRNEGGPTVVVRSTFFQGTTSQSKIVALKAEDGQELWSGGAVSWPLTIGHGRILVSDWHSQTECFDSTTGRQLWSCEYPTWGALEVKDVLVLSTYYKQTLVGVDAATGTVKWQIPLSATDAPSMEASRDVVMARSYSTGDVKVVDAIKGNTLYSLSVKRGFEDGSRLVTVRDGRIFYYSNSTLIAADLRTNKSLWQVDVEGEPTGVAALRGVVMAVTSKGTFAFGVSDGAPRWHTASASDRSFHVVYVH